MKDKVEPGMASKLSVTKYSSLSLKYSQNIHKIFKLQSMENESKQTTGCATEFYFYTEVDNYHTYHRVGFIVDGEIYNDVVRECEN